MPGATWVASVVRWTLRPVITVSNLSNCRLDLEMFLESLKGAFSSIWHYKNSDRPFQILSPFGESKTGQDAPKCCVV